MPAKKHVLGTKITASVSKMTIMRNKNHLKTNVQKPASQHTFQLTLKKKARNQTSKNQKASSKGGRRQRAKPLRSAAVRPAALAGVLSTRSSKNLD